jgi:hypothetical protein
MLVLINTYSKEAGCKINLKNQLVFYIPIVEKEVRKIIPFIVALKKIKQLGINLRK